ncbi:MAG: sensor domain-containing diguanylate cyclase [Spirochaetaceae bacterium]|nr:sensor domain-containing diguanylate cyclase [Spirochaetaceae bacterium]
MDNKKHLKEERVTQFLLNEINTLKESIEQYESKINRYKKLNEVTTIISSTLNKNEILKRVLIQTKEFMNCEKSSILLVDPLENNLKFEVLTDDKEMKDLQHIRLNMGEGVAGKVWETGRSIIIEDTSKDIRFTNKVDRKIKETTDTLLASPLIIKGNIIGVMEAMNKQNNSNFTSFDLEIFEKLALHAAIAIENAELYMAGICDKMTGLYNHEFFMDQLEKEFQRSRRYGHSLSLIMFDIDHFKNFNDTYGHQLGDQVIIKIASILRDSCRKDLDSACRYGGEEFAFILPETDKEGAIKFGERIRVAIEKLIISYNEENVPVTISGGISNLADHKPETGDDFIKMTDRALYHSKKNGRNRISYFTEKMQLM